MVLGNQQPAPFHVGAAGETPRGPLHNLTQTPNAGVLTNWQLIHKSLSLENPEDIFKEVFYFWGVV